MSINNIDVRTYQLYALVDPNDNSVRYVGQTRAGLAARLNQHISQARREPGSPKTNWINSLVSSEQIPLVEELESGLWTQEECDDREAYWIAYYRDRHGDKMTNRHARGSGLCGHTYTDEERIRHGAAMSTYLSTPEGKEQRRQTMLRRYQENPERTAQDTAAMRAWMDDPANKERHRNRLKQLYVDEPERKKIIADETRTRWADPDYQARTTLQSEEYRARRSEIAKRLHAQKRSCDMCDRISSPQNLGRHQKASGHRGYTVIEEVL